MRVTRVEKFKKYRRRKTKRFFIFAILLPCSFIFLGYIISSLIILPAMAK